MGIRFVHALATAISAATVAAVMAATAAPAIAQQAPEPSDYPFSYLAGIRAQAADPGSAPPGTNDPTCRSERNPVVLLHGFVSNSTLTWQALAPLLRDRGYCVFTFDYGRADFSGTLGGITPVEPSATEFARFVDEVLADTGADAIDLIGHSEGGTMPFHFLTRLGGADKVDRYIGIAPLYRGTSQWGLAGLIGELYSSPAGQVLTDVCGACRDMVSGSAFLAELDPHGDAAPSVQFTNIMTRYDQNATPYTTGVLEGRNVSNVVVQDLCSQDYSDHYQLTYSPTTAHIVLGALDANYTATPTCSPSLPVLGVPGS
ncbi:MAG: alpha/beta fold hydrolase [Rhodococcus sp. (in: high G+C Gram-positive bacteria)]